MRLENGHFGPKLAFLSLFPSVQGARGDEFNCEKWETSSPIQGLPEADLSDMEVSSARSIEDADVAVCNDFVVGNEQRRAKIGPNRAN